MTSGIYYISVTDGNGCQTVGSTTVTEPTTLSASITGTDVGCNSGNDGTANLLVTGGTTPYSYSWSNGATTEDLLGLAAGSYTVTITDANSCTTTSSVTISQPAALSTSISSTNVSCNGGNDGSVDLTVSGGTTSYSYSWSNGATTQDLTGLSTGSYDVTVTDTNGCIATTGVTISEPSALSTLITSTDVSCNGTNDGSADLIVSGGTPVYSYNWSNGSTTQDLSGLAVGTYIVTITDGNSCQAIDSVTITEPNALGATTITTDVNCNGGADGSVDLTVTGGIFLYTYSWSNGATAEDLAGLTTGVYSVTITDANNCQIISSVTINEPSALILTTSTTDASCGSADGSATIAVAGGVSPYTYSWSSGGTSSTETGLTAGSYSVTVIDTNGCIETANANISNVGGPTVTAVITDASCQAISDGAVDITVSGGATPYSYNWSNGATTEDISGLLGGIYTVTVTEASGCQTTFSATVNQPTPISASIAATNASCLGFCDGAVDLTISGGTSGYTYSWSSGATTEDLSGLCAGSYSVTVTDASSCQANASTIIVDTIGISLSFNVTNASCDGTCDGKIITNVLGGQPAYSYLWSNGAITKNLNGLCPGTYTVTVTDANGCQGVDSVTIATPGAVTVSISTTDAICNGACDGSIDLTPSGGASPYSYVWSNNSSLEDLAGLCSGTYSVTVTDNNGCQGTANAIITEPSPISISFTTTNVTCNGGADGAIDLTVSGGTLGYTYIWTNGATTEDLNGILAGTYNVTIIDSSGCQAITSATLNEPNPITLTINTVDASCGAADGSASINVSGGTSPYTYMWSSGGTADTEMGLVAGSYYVTITDANSCTILDSINISNSIPAVLISTNDVTCNGSNDGSATITASGGATPYSYNWSSGVTDSAATGLTAGNYIVSVSDINGCMAIQSFAINEPLAISLSVFSSDVTCNGNNDGNAVVVATGGVSPYSYNWDATTGLQTTPTATGLIAGTYTVIVTDTNICSDSISVTVNEPASISLVTSVTNTNCGGNNGIASVMVSGGTIPYTYLWSDGQTDSTATGLAAGTYDITVTDANNCVAMASLVISDIGGPTVSVNGGDASCNGNCDGSAVANVTGGISPYSYLWDDPNNQTNQVTTGLCAGSYNVTVTDSAGCTGTASVIIIEPAALSLTTSASNPTNGNCNGVAAVSVSGGTSPYNYQWDDPNNQTSDIATGLCAGAFCVIVSDSNGCTDTACIVLADTTSGCNLTLSTSSTDDFCNTSEGMTAVIASNGTLPYSYQWDDPNSQISAVATGLSTGMYSVTVTDNTGCADTASITVNSITPMALASVITNESCPNENDGEIAISVTGGTTPYTFNWSNSENTEDISELTEGSYIINIVDANGCGITDTMNVEIESENCLNIPTAFTPNNDGKNDKWVIRGLYDNTTVEIYNRWGSVLFSSTGYPDAWDGTYNGKDVPAATYYYIITLIDGTSHTGFIRIVR
ncbi:MAG: hypothetical protein COA57_01730 [Flavobacteriales bacterium]|nr:MAG: hypothetical protein COA57_01730 [Flavobacteriales bacterium]